MEHLPRHRCLVYSESPSKHLAGLAALIRQKMAANYRCLYLNSPTMVLGIRSYLVASGLDVDRALIKGQLILSSDQMHLVDGGFDPHRMMDLLASTLDEAIRDGYRGLWASGDMAWEFGPRQDFGKLVEYERLLEDFFQRRPEMCGVCQYHRDVLPPGVAETGLSLHPALYINETLARLNPDYVSPQPGAADR